MIFNRSGRVLPNEAAGNFTCGASTLEVTNEYTYLGIKIKPSGTFTGAIHELYTKASRAWFSFSNVIFQHKKLPINKAFRIFHSLVAPIALYGSEIWTSIMDLCPKIDTIENLISFWIERY